MSQKKRQPIKVRGASIKHQSGQTMVFALVFIVVILIGVLILFNTGQLTRHKMEVQNAADAAAYSAAILTARELNFMAYTNRAMVANQVTLGQFAAFKSWGNKYALARTGLPKVSGYLQLQTTLLILGPPYAALANTAIKTYFRALATAAHVGNTAIAGVIDGLFGTFANIYIPSLQLLYAGHQQMLRLATLGAQFETVRKIIDDNAKGATLSNFGAVAAILSAAAQNAPGPFSFTKMGFGGDEKKRFAALVNDSRYKHEATGVCGDAVGVTRQVGWTRSRCRQLGISLDFGPLSFGIPFIAPPIVWLDLVVSNSGFMGYDNIKGGTELRFIDENDPKFGWSSMDTVQGMFGFQLSIEVCPSIPWLGDPPLKQITCFDLPIPYLGAGVPPFPPLSFGGTAYENSEGRGRGQTLGDRSPSPNWNQGTYGKVWDETPIAANETFNPLHSADDLVQNQTGLGKYRGLPFYMDVNKDLYPDGTNTAPTFLLGVRKNASDDVLESGDELDTLRTSDELNIGIDTGEIKATTRLAGGRAGFGNTQEGSPGSGTTRFIQCMAAEYRAKLVKSINEAASGGVGSCSTFPYNTQPFRGYCQDAVNGVISTVDIVNDEVDKFTNKLFSKINGLDRLLGDAIKTGAADKGGVFAIAAAEVYFKNPDGSDTKGSTFSPYWQVRLKPVDDAIRRWSVISQGLDLKSPSMLNSDIELQQRPLAAMAVNC